MESKIALLRGINVGGHRKVRMADLRIYLAGMGYQEVQTYIQSGNVLFKSEKSSQVLEAEIEALLQAKFGFGAATLVLCRAEWEAIHAENPFLPEKEDEIIRLSVTILSEAPAPEALAALDASQYLPDSFEVRGRAVYLYHPNGYGRTKLVHTFFEKAFGTSATNRNWKTVRKLLSMVEEA